jgi:hypothetical protein
MACGMADNEGLLASAVDQLNKHWDSAGMSWHDKAREDFEQEHLEEMRRAVKVAQMGMRNIHELLRQVIRECS